MKTIKIIMILLNIYLFTKCQSKIDHSKEIEYYVILQKDAINQSELINSYIYQLVKPFKDSYFNPELDVNKSYIDSINKTAELIKMSIDNSIKSLSKLNEIDQEIKLKDKSIEYYNDTQIYLDSIKRQVIDVLNVGLENASDEQRTAMQKLAADREILKKEQEQLSDLFNEFLKKHNITEDELKNNGL